MADPPPFIRFKRPANDQVPLYARALQFAARVYAVIELAERERYFLRDQLDRKSTIVPQWIAQGLATSDMALRRSLYQRAREAIIDCEAILDLLRERASVALAALEPARAAALDLRRQLAPLTVPPRMQR
jgi:four helix bundle protein